MERIKQRQRENKASKEILSNDDFGLQRKAQTL
jgi:hypothetical protein